MVPEEYPDRRSGCLRTGKVNLKMMEQVRRREQVIKPEPPLDGYAEIAAPFGGHGLLDLKNMLLAVLLFVFTGWQWNIQVRIRFWTAERSFL